MRWRMFIYCEDKQKNYYEIWFSSGYYDNELSYKYKRLHDLMTNGDGWLKGLSKDVVNGYKMIDRNGNFNLIIVKDGKFNPHYRLNKELYPTIWIDCHNISKVGYYILDINNKTGHSKKVFETCIDLTKDNTVAEIQNFIAKEESK
jgi:hypothetical protein